MSKRVREFNSCRRPCEEKRGGFGWYYYYYYYYSYYYNYQYYNYSKICGLLLLNGF